MATMIGIPEERAEQLRSFAKELNITVADAIGVLINDAVKAGKIADVMPGFKVERTGKDVTIEAFGAFTKSINADLAKMYAGQIRAATRSILAPGQDNPFLQTFGLSVVRRGSGIKLVDTDTKGEKTLAPSVADDVARLIEKAAS